MSDYGKGIASASVAATETTAPVAATTSGLYSWSSDQYKVVVFNHPAAADYLYIKWNADTCAKTGSGWDACVAPGAELVSPDGILVEKVAVWIDSAMTYGTNHVINGWS